MKKRPITISKIFTDCITENDGNTVCPFRVAAMILCGSCVPTFIGCTIYMLVYKGIFDPSQFGICFGTMTTSLAALAGGVSIKARTDGINNSGTTSATTN